MIGHSAAFFRGDDAERCSPRQQRRNEVHSFCGSQMKTKCTWRRACLSWIRVKKWMESKQHTTPLCLSTRAIDSRQLSPTSLRTPRPPLHSPHARHASRCRCCSARCPPG
ncbi:hypothetical protein AMAG_19841 [Allomyces macrogynus ATCC 38327]|uniref:Uncharacterized protein n=1 Tax=Allomyces macrogynus (strain ATCC 38327) TaxID=578462 RepID=A0A0L0T091_ALLM3|nr:hypothetical protein AMAG_19841 [Allomyces macrogynus ATCC 38327]|eukprot:KNE68065.1 hypothetical protein AMAG_19841 [Allomyces macrogynus ATCC 38327]